VTAATAAAATPAPAPATRTGAEMIWEVLVQEGVDVVFGYPGGAIMPAYDALPRYPVRHVLVRHEQGAAHMADGYARASGRVGVAVATSGPGATNLVTGIATAMLDSVPVVFITGQVSSALLGTDAFQETDVTGVTLGKDQTVRIAAIQQLPGVQTSSKPRTTQVWIRRLSRRCCRWNREETIQAQLFVCEVRQGQNRREGSS
jgi:2-succinyl-5-enolpyruvyl-6-hydroxy-3-cyclohexene-1-carboxylate synthase